MMLFVNKGKLFEPLRNISNHCYACCCGQFRIRGYDSDQQPQSIFLDLFFFLREASEAIPFNYLETFLFIQNIFLCMLSTDK
jgi:hypothetical protein